jgi:hypothetical protein
VNLSRDEMALVRWALTVGVEWEQESIRCQSDRFTDKDLRGYKKLNNESRRRIVQSGELIKRIDESIRQAK